MKKDRIYNIILTFIILSFLIGVITGVLITLTANAQEDDEELITVPWDEREHVIPKKDCTAEEKEAAPEPEPAPAPAPAPEPAPEPVEETESFIDYEVGLCEITAYCTCVKCCGIWSAEHPSRIGTGYVQKTASGTIPTAGRTVAVDPEVIPLGSIVMINGVSYIAEDTGNAVKGKVVDICFGADHEAAVQFGRQEANVYYIWKGERK